MQQVSHHVYQPLPRERVFQVAPSVTRSYVTTYTTTHVVTPPAQATPSFTLPMQVESPVRAPVTYSVSIPATRVVEAPPTYYTTPVVTQTTYVPHHYGSPPPMVEDDPGAWQGAWDYADYTDYAEAEQQLPAEEFQVDGREAGTAMDGEFLHLLESLEARVDLMSQMQNTRAAIQRRAQEIEEQNRESYEAAIQRRAQEIAQMNREASEAAFQRRAQEIEEMNRDPYEVAIQRRAQEIEEMNRDPYEDLPFPDDAFRPAPIQSQMRAQFQDQRECITRLAGTVSDMRRRLLAMETDAVVAGATSVAAHEDRGEQPTIAVFSPEGVELGAGPAGRCALDDTQPVGAALMAAVTASLEEARRQDASPGKALRSTTESYMIQPFSLDACGVNLSISEDGYLAARMRGCRQSVAIGSAPLTAQHWGYYFEVEVRETVAGWVGGLGIGVTSTSPQSLRRVPDKAWRMPNSYIVGYWGCIFIDGKEHRTAWHSDSLCAGSRVGLLVTGDRRGDLIVFVNGRPVVRAEGALLGDGEHSASLDEPLYPVVDVFAATRVVALSKFASPPPPPWHIDESLARPSPPGSPGSVSRSLWMGSVCGREGTSVSP